MVQPRCDVPDGSKFATGISATDPWWHVDGRWFSDDFRRSRGGSWRWRSGWNLHAAKYGTDRRRRDTLAHLTITGIVSTGGREDNAILAPLEIAQDLAGRPGQYRRLLVSALTKPADAFSATRSRYDDAGGI